jgi:glycosyltransferase 2 family protein
MMADQPEPSGRRPSNIVVATGWEVTPPTEPPAGKARHRMQVLNTISAVTRAVDEKVGWNRIAFAISLLIIGVAVVVLFRLLRDVDVDKVIDAMEATSPRTVLLAGVLVAAGYVTLTFYDFFALRTIGRTHVPYRIAALASFTSYTIGHNLGATVFTGGVVRLRIYSRWGLGIVDIAKIAFVTGLTFWLGNAFILGLSMAYAPDAASAVNQLPPWLNRTIALAGLATIIGYVLWLLPGPRAIGSGDWQIILPNAPLTFVQIGIGIADLTIGALAMYALLPSEPAIDFTTLLVTFVLATLLGFLSHAPGSLGVFDAAMLVGLSQFDKNELLASLLIFRLLYFILPFFTALCIVSARELWLSLTQSGESEPPPPPPA